MTARQFITQTADAEQQPGNGSNPESRTEEAVSRHGKNSKKRSTERSEKSTRRKSPRSSSTRLNKAPTPWRCTGPNSKTSLPILTTMTRHTSTSSMQGFPNEHRLSWQCFQHNQRPSENTNSQVRPRRKNHDQSTDHRGPMEKNIIPLP